MAEQTYSVWMANLESSSIPVESFQEAIMLERKWNSLNRLLIDDTQFNELIEMLSSQDEGSHVLAVGIILNNIQDYTLTTNICSVQAEILKKSFVSYNFRKAFTKLVLNELQS
jgi:hypothetical protein